MESTCQFIEHFSTFISTFNLLEEFVIAEFSPVLAALTFLVLDREHERVKKWRSTCPQLKVCKFDGKQVDRAWSRYHVWLIRYLAGVTWTLNTGLHRSAWEPTAGEVATHTDLIHQWKIMRTALDAINISRTVTGCGRQPMSVSSPTT